MVAHVREADARQAAIYRAMTPRRRLEQALRMNAAMRRLLLDSTARAGLSTDVAQQFTLAVNEIVINAIRHAGGVATVTVAVTEPGDGRDGRIAVTVSDTGPGLAPHIRPELPPADRTNGRGLWLAHRMCDDIEIESSPRGTVVRLRATASNPC